MASDSNSFQVPRREDLLRQIASANRWGNVVALVELLAVVALAMFIDWRLAFQEPWVTVVAIGAVVGPFAMNTLRFVVAKKKRIEDLQEKTRFGEFDKHRLRALFQDTLNRLRLPDDRLPVFVVADKSMNAMMMHVGMGSLLKSINGIYLHRQSLHKLNSEEVQDLMGHELGHYYRHYLVSDRYRLLTLPLGGLIGLFIAQSLGMDGIFSIVALVASSHAFWWLTALPQRRHMVSIEYLCDDLGAQVHGITTSVAGLMKLGAEAEVLTAVQQQAVFSAQRGNLNAHEVVEAINEAIPYGHATKEELHQAVEKRIQQKSAEGTSLSGFLRYMWQSDLDAEASEEFDREMRKLKVLSQIPRLPWESLLRDPKEIRFDEHSLSRLVEMIEANPHAVLFHTAEALGQSDGMHPPLVMRILYLWHNRREIQQAAGSHRIGCSLCKCDAASQLLSIKFANVDVAILACGSFGEGLDPVAITLVGTFSKLNRMDDSSGAAGAIL